jgi:hypothetical protein
MFSSMIFSRDYRYISLNVGPNIPLTNLEILQTSDHREGITADYSTAPRSRRRSTRRRLAQFHWSQTQTWVECTILFRPLFLKVAVERVAYQLTDHAMSW